MERETRPLEILLVEADPLAAKRIPALLRADDLAGYRLTHVTGLAQAHEHLARGGTDVVLLAATLPECEGPETVRRLVEAAPRVAVLGLVDDEAECTAEEAIRAGAWDCLVRDALDPHLLGHTIRYAVAHERLQEEHRRAEEALRESEARFRTVLENAPIGMALVGTDGCWLMVNPALCRLVGYSEQELLGLTFQQITHPDDLDADLAQAQRLLAGEIPSYEMEKRYLHKRGHPVWILLTVSLVRDGQDHALYFIAQIQDITERKRAEETSRFLSEAAQVLASSLDYEQTLHTVARLVVPQLADWCVIDLREEDALMSTMEVAAADPPKEELLRGMRARYPVDATLLRHPVGRVVESGRPVLWESIRPAMLEQMAQDEEHLGMLRQLAPLSSIIVPLLARGRILGALTLSTSESGRHYSRRDLSAAQDLAYTAALAIDNALLYREAREAVRSRDEVLGFAAQEPRSPLAASSASAVPLQEEPAAQGENPGTPAALPGSAAPAERPLRVLLVDDHPLARQGLAEMLRQAEGFELVGEAATGEEAVEMARELQPDLIVMDLVMPGIGGIEAIRRIGALGIPSRVLVLSADGGAASVAEAMQAGAGGYLRKTAAAEQLIPALQAVARGEMLLDPTSGSLLLSGLRLATGGAPADPLEGLKEQERKVLTLAAQGHTAAQIGKLLYLSPKTVESYRSRAMQKLGLESRADLIAFALRVGLLST